MRIVNSKYAEIPQLNFYPSPLRFFLKNHETDMLRFAFAISKIANKTRRKT